VITSVSRRAGAARRGSAPGRAASMTGGQRRLVAVFLLPAFLYYGVFFLGPALATVWISLTTWSGLGSDMVFVGLSNYRGMFQDPMFWLSFGNTLQILLVVGVSVFAVSFFFMAVLREMKGRQFIRAVIFFPSVVAPVALAIAWGFVFDPQAGLINAVLRIVGLGSIQPVWLGPDLILKSVMAGLIWINVGFFATILLSAVDRIPAPYYEASAIEGASELQKFIYVTLPMTWDVLSIAAVLWVISAIKVFEFIYAFGATSGAPPTSLWTSAIFMYMVTLGNRSPIYKLGYGSAIAVSMVVLTAVLVLLIRRVLRREAIEF